MQGHCICAISTHQQERVALLAHSTPHPALTPSPCPTPAQSLMMNNPSGAVSMAKMIAKQVPPPIAINTMADLFLQRNMVREGTAFLLEALSGDKAEEGPLQTKLLEINLITNPQVGVWDWWRQCGAMADGHTMLQLCCVAVSLPCIMEGFKGIIEAVLVHSSS